ncbi:unnamed protein product [Symbiodinium sp. CCMP2592]|nr:unnamed protein product [Symbiodinium sp. CCMP2592]
MRNLHITRHEIPSEKSGDLGIISQEYSSCCTDGTEDSEEDSIDASQQKAAAFLIQHFRVHEARHLNLETESLYGAVILVPQLGRSCGWPRALMFVSLQVYVLFILNGFLQAVLLMEISREQNVLDVYAGQMWLCDFGAPLIDCPDDPSCTGPGGTQVDGRRLYDYRSWSTRTFFRDSLKKLFPDRVGEIDRDIDPGEYGAESRLIRWICCFIFMLSISEELILISKMCRLLYKLPSSAESWIEFKDPGDEQVGDAWLEYVEVSVQGMPFRWKVINCVLILGIKVALWSLTARTGVTFLMETQAISDCIVNSVALAFVLHMDELILSTLTSHRVTAALSKCKAYCIESEDASDWRFKVEQEVDNSWVGNIGMGIPLELLASLLLCSVFIGMYYYDHCIWSWEGWWFYSKPMHLPLSSNEPLASAFFPWFFPLEGAADELWSMPSLWHAE